MADRIVWGALWRENNRLNGKVEHIINGPDCVPALFRTRKDALAFIIRAYGYIRDRKDLRVEPHGWRLPIPVRVTIRRTSTTTPRSAQ